MTRTAPKSRPAGRIADAFASLRGLGIVDRTVYSAILRSTLESNPSFLGVWSVWEPDALDGHDTAFRHAEGHDESGRFVPFWHRASGRPKLDPVTGYEKRGTGDWYWVPRQMHELCAMEPYLYPVGGRLLLITSEVAPLIAEGRFLGVVGIDFLASATIDPPSSAARRTYSHTPTVRVLDSSSRHQPLRSLTSREREVHYWLSQGKSNEEIAIILGISAHTVKNHLERVFQKLGVDNRYAAALTG